MFVHVYETYLKERCGYEGQMPYVDVDLGWEAS